MMDIKRGQAGMARSIRMVGMIIQKMMDIERGQAGWLGLLGWLG